MQSIRGTAWILMLAAVAAPVVAYGQWVWTPETGRFINLKRLPKETAELQLEHARSLMLQGELESAMSETDKFIDFYDGDPLSDQNQFLRGDIQFAQGDYIEAAQEYQQVVLNFPDSDLFSQVIEEQYKIGDTLFDKGTANMARHDNAKWYQWRVNFLRKRPFRKAIRVYDMVKTNQPFTPEAAEAQYKIGLCYYTLEEYIEAEIEYQAVLERYPSSEYVDDAGYGLIKTFEARALPPQYDQEPSQLAIDALTDFRNNYPNDERIAELGDLEVRMKENIAQQKLLVAQFYERRQQFPSARIYYNVVVEQFPDSEAAKTAQTWITEHPTDPSSVGKFITPSYQ